MNEWVELGEVGGRQVVTDTANIEGCLVIIGAIVVMVLVTPMINRANKDGTQAADNGDFVRAAGLCSVPIWIALGLMLFAAAWGISYLGRYENELEPYQSQQYQTQQQPTPIPPNRDDGVIQPSYPQYYKTTSPPNHVWCGTYWELWPEGWLCHR